MRQTPQQVLATFMNMCDTGDIQDRPLFRDGEVVGYLFSAHPVHFIIMPHSDLAQDILAALKVEGCDVVLMRKPREVATNIPSANLGLLTAEERECWELRSSPIRAIAGKVGRSPSTVRRRLASARAKLLHIQAGR